MSETDGGNGAPYLAGKDLTEWGIRRLVRYSRRVCGRMKCSCMNHGYDPILRISLRADEAPKGSFL